MAYSAYCNTHFKPQVGKKKKVKLLTDYIKYFINSAKCLLAAYALLSSMSCYALSSRGEIALTFDDVPNIESPNLTQVARATEIVEALKNNKVQDAFFFVRADYISEQTASVLTQYTQSGFHLANHSYSHQSLTVLGVDAFIADAQLAQEKLKGFQNIVPYYRYPYLDYGNNIETLLQAQNKLVGMGYKDGYITVKTYDWYLNDRYTALSREEQRRCSVELKNLYVNHVESTIEFYDNLARKALGRSPKHVLLLHENDLAAHYLGDLIRDLNSKGWKIVSPEQAYKDPIQRQFPKELSHSQGRVAALASSKGFPENKLISPSENTEYLLKQFNKINCRLY